MNNTSKIEGLITVRNDQGQIIAIAQRLEGEPKYEIYSVAVIGVDELVALFNNLKEQKL